MKDPTLELRIHYLDRIKNISVPAFNMPQQTDKPPFVVVSTRSAQELLTKCGYNHRVTTTFDIVVTTDGDWGGDKLTEDIANEITPLIMPLGSTTNFRIVTAMIDGSDPVDDLYSTGRVIRKVIILTNLVSQLN